MLLLLGRRDQSGEADAGQDGAAAAAATQQRSPFRRNFEEDEAWSYNTPMHRQGQSAGGLHHQQQQQQQQSPPGQRRQTGKAAQQRGQAAAATRSQQLHGRQPVYPDNHPMHPEDSRLNVKWPRSNSRTKKATEIETQTPVMEVTQPQQLLPPPQSPPKLLGSWTADVATRLPRHPPSKRQPPPQPQLTQFEGNNKFDPWQLHDPTMQPSPPMQPIAAGDWTMPGGHHQLQQLQQLQQMQQPQPAAATVIRSELADQHLHRLFEEIYAIRGEAETVQYKYRRERDAWAYENAALQAQLAELAERLHEKSDRLAGLEADYADEMESLRSENRELHLRIHEDRLQAEEAAEAATANGAPGGSVGLPGGAAERQVDELMAELYSLKKELDRLQTRYRTERETWQARRRDLQQAIDDLSAGKEPKLVQKRLAQASAELARDGGGVAAALGDEVDPEELAHASMTNYLTANVIKKEKAVLELELDDEKRKNRVLEIEVEVLRDQVMRAQSKARGIDLEEGGGAGGGGGGVGGDTMEKGSLETPEKRLEARRASMATAARGGGGGGARGSATPGLGEQEPVRQQQQQQQLDQLRQEREQATAKLDEAQQRKEALQQKLADAKSELKAASAERDAAKAEGARLKEENERRKDEMRRMREELARSGEQEEQEKAAKRKDAEEKARLEDENRDLKDKMDKKRREQDAELDKLRQEKRKLEEKLRIIRDKMQEGQENYKHFQGEFEELAKLCE